MEMSLLKMDVLDLYTYSIAAKVRPDPYIAPMTNTAIKPALVHTEARRFIRIVWT
jgi:hypothetical protein